MMRDHEATAAHPKTPLPPVTDGDLDDPQIIALLAYHLEMARAVSPPCSVHALDLGGLKSDAVRFYALWEGETLLGVGALKHLTPDHGEVKSMHTAREARRRGVARAMVRHIIDAARAAGMAQLSLETGAEDYFAPARALYHALGFRECPPFGDYRPDPNSRFMTLDLAPAARGRD